MSDSLQPHSLKQSKLPSPSPAPGVCLNSHPVGQWCHPTTSSSVTPSTVSAELETCNSPWLGPKNWGDPACTESERAKSREGAGRSHLLPPGGWAPRPGWEKEGVGRTKELVIWSQEREWQTGGWSRPWTSEVSRYNAGGSTGSGCQAEGHTRPLKAGGTGRVTWHAPDAPASQWRAGPFSSSPSAAEM